MVAQLVQTLFIDKIWDFKSRLMLYDDQADNYLFFGSSSIKINPLEIIFLVVWI